MKKFILGLASVATLGFAINANAALKVGIDDLSDNSGTAIGSFTFEHIAVDNGFGDATTPVAFDTIAGLLSTSYASADLEVSTSLASSKPVETGSPQVIHLNSTFTTYDGKGAASIVMTDTGFTGYSSLIFDLSVLSANGTASAQAYIGLNNQEFELGELIGTYTEGGLVDLSKYDVADPSQMYSLTIVTTFSHNNNGTSSADTGINVPEPSVLALFGAGLLGLGVARRRMAK